MTARRPFADDATLFTAAREIAQTLSRADWLEAFAAHPKIGSLDALRSKFAHTATWSAHEQGAISSAAEETLKALAAGNDEYEAKFGYIFIVCATGKSAGEMLAILQNRMTHSPTDELAFAAAEQEKITAIRLRKMLEDHQDKTL